MSTQVIFLGFVVCVEGMCVDSRKIRVIIEWLESKNFYEVCSFHSFATFYGQFIHGCSMVIVPITDCIRKWDFHWTTTTSKAFKEIKSRMMLLSCTFQTSRKSSGLRVTYLVSE